MSGLSRLASAKSAPVLPETLAQCLHANGVVPVIELPRPGLAVPLAEVLLEAGLGCMELTFRTAGADEAIAAVRQRLPDMMVGAGTVLTIEDAVKALEAGAQFIVAPGTNRRIVDYVTARGTVMVPGVATPSEIEANHERGLRLLKFFPAAPLGGVQWLKAIEGPFRDVRFLATGGVSATDLREYLGRPNVLACGGTWIAPRAILEIRGWTQVRERARQALAIVRESREEALAMASKRG